MTRPPSFTALIEIEVDPCASLSLSRLSISLSSFFLSSPLLLGKLDCSRNSKPKKYHLSLPTNPKGHCVWRESLATRWRKYDRKGKYSYLGKTPEYFRSICIKCTALLLGASGSVYTEPSSPPPRPSCRVVVSDWLTSTCRTDWRDVKDNTQIARWVDSHKIPYCADPYLHDRHESISKHFYVKKSVTLLYFSFAYTAHAWLFQTT